MGVSCVCCSQATRTYRSFVGLLFPVWCGSWVNRGVKAAKDPWRIMDVYMAWHDMYVYIYSAYIHIHIYIYICIDTVSHLVFYKVNLFISFYSIDTVVYNVLYVIKYASLYIYIYIDIYIFCRHVPT